MKYIIGHPAYSGANRPDDAICKSECVRVLVLRDVPLDDVKRANKEAEEGKHATMRTRDGEVVELITITKGSQHVEHSA